MAAMQPPAPAAMDPEDMQDGGADEAREGDGGFEIIIKVAADGSLSVGCETAAQEAAEGTPGAAPDDDSGFTPAKDAKQALTMALGYIKSNGKSDGSAAMGQKLQSAGFASGYEED